LSDGLHVYIDDFNAIVEDFAEFVTDMKKQFGGVRILRFIRILEIARP